jgi:hypothetical protein
LTSSRFAEISPGIIWITTGFLDNNAGSYEYSREGQGKAWERVNTDAPEEIDEGKALNRSWEIC